jgi:hypothetical protein
MSNTNKALAVVGVTVVLAFVGSVVAAGIKHVKNQKKDKEDNEIWKQKTGKHAEDLLAKIKFMENEYKEILRNQRELDIRLKVIKTFVVNHVADIRSEIPKSTEHFRVCYGFIVKYENAISSVNAELVSLKASSEKRPPAKRKQAKN